MKIPEGQKERVAKMLFNTVYPLYVIKVQKKNRTEEELQTVICWLTGFTFGQLQEYIGSPVSFQDFFDQAELNENATLITGTICGYRIEEIEDPLIKKVRMLDKLVDELAKGRKMEKILRM